VSERYQCERCDGSGVLEWPAPCACPQCGGTGDDRVEDVPANDNDDMPPPAVAIPQGRIDDARQREMFD
jgi:hypothetical protein